MQRMSRCKVLFVITQFYKGGAEVALLNLLKSMSPEKYEVDFLIFDQMILDNAYSLIPEVPKWVNLCNAAEKEGRFAVVTKVWFKLYRKLTKRQLCRPSAIRFVKNKEYDIAFSFGEWMSPEFVAKRVKAKRKYVWIHTDIDKAKFVNPNILLGYDSDYTGYIFVSEKSKESAERKFPLLKGKSVVVHNMCDEEGIIQASKEGMNTKGLFLKPTLLSVGNLREEKNYPRQIEVMRILKERGIDVKWVCIGSTANIYVYQQVKKLLDQYSLQEDYIFIGVDNNPYKYMKKAEAIMVLSDFESWSMVITEAKLIGKTVIATPTSGAKEQIEDGKNGLLTSFSEIEIADKIQHFLKNKELQVKIQENLKGFSVNKMVMLEFEKLIRSK